MNGISASSLIARLPRRGWSMLFVIVLLLLIPIATTAGAGDSPAAAPEMQSVDLGPAYYAARPTRADDARIARQLRGQPEQAPAAASRSAAPDPSSDLLFKWLTPDDGGVGLSVNGTTLTSRLPAAALGLPASYYWTVLTFDQFSPTLQAFDRAPDTGNRLWSGSDTTLTDGSSSGIPAYADLRQVRMRPDGSATRTDFTSAAALPTGEVAGRLGYNLNMQSGSTDLVQYIGSSLLTPSGWRWAIRDRGSRFPWWSSSLDLSEAGVSFPDERSIRFTAQVSSGLQSSYGQSDAWPRFEWFLDLDNDIASGDSFTFSYQEGSYVFRYDLEGVEALVQAYYDPLSRQWLGVLRRKTGPGVWENVATARPTVESDRVSISFSRTETAVRSTFRWGAVSSFDLSRGGQDYFGRVDVAPNAGMRAETVAVDADLLLAEQYAPVLYRATTAGMFPVNIEYTIQNATLRDSSGNVISNTPTAEALAENATNGSYLDLHGTGPRETLFRWHSMPEAGRSPTAYARIERQGQQTAIQYWFHYFYSGWGAASGCYLSGVGCFAVGAGNNHEGDWEMIQVNLIDGLPHSATYAQHDSAARRLWQHVERQGDHPVVYVGLGSHAGFFRDSYYGHVVTSVFNENTGRTPVETLGVLRLMSGAEPPWLMFRGRWGADGGAGGSGRGPIWADTSTMRRNWDDPFDWAATADWDDEKHYTIDSAAFKATIEGWESKYVELQLRSLTGAVLLSRTANQFDSQRRSAEYLLNCENDSRQTLLIHKNRRPLGSYLWLEPSLSQLHCTNGRTPDAPGDLLNLSVDVVIPDPAGSRVRRLQFSDMQIPTDGVARIPLDAAAPQLEIDANGDGVFEQSRPPTKTEERPADFLAPNAVATLGVADAVSPVRLIWTAPADDGPTGRAMAYEVRYASFPLTEETWDYGTPYEHDLTPAAAGTPESLSINGLPPGAYYFAVRAVDSAYNRSELSPSVLVRVPTGLYLPLVQR